MVHDRHHGESPRDYFVEQLLTIFVVGLFGAVAILLYNSGKLEIVLDKTFHVPVLIGGIALLVLVAVRAFSVWREAGALQAHNHGHSHDRGHSHDHGHAHHEHGPDCDHEHDADCGHDHSHDHDHHDHDHGDHSAADHGHSQDMAWVLARMMVLFFPVALFLIGVPSKGYSNEQLGKIAGSDDPLSLGNLSDVTRKEGTVMSFNDLNDSAFDEGKRSYLQGQTAVLEGMFRRLGDKEFTLMLMKRACCTPDSVALKVRIVTPYALSGYNDYDGVQIKGQVQFLPVPNTSPPRYIPVIKVDNADIKKVELKSIYE